MLKLASRASLTRMSWVNFDHLNTPGLRFVVDEAKQLGKCPTVQASLGFHVLVVFATSDLGTLPNVGQVLQDNGTARGSTLYDAFAQDMIVIFSLPQQVTRKLFQVPFSRFACA